MPTLAVRPHASHAEAFPIRKVFPGLPPPKPLPSAVRPPVPHASRRSLRHRSVCVPGNSRSCLPILKQRNRWPMKTETVRANCTHTGKLWICLHCQIQFLCFLMLPEKAEEWPDPQAGSFVPDMPVRQLADFKNFLKTTKNDWFFR